MTNLEYAQTQRAMMRLSEIICHLPLEEFLDSLGRSDAVGDIYDPALYRKAAAPLAKIKEIAESLAAVKVARVAQKEEIDPGVNAINEAAAEAFLKALQQ